MIRFAMAWVGDKFGSEYPAILADMIRRNASLVPEMTIHCVTDRPDELPEGVEPIAPYPGLQGWWQKCWLFSPLMPWNPGDTIVYFDLDVAITGRLEDLVETPGIMRDPLWPCYNSSVMVWRFGDHSAVWSALTPARTMLSPDPVVPAECLPRSAINGGDQSWITEVDQLTTGAPWRLLPRDWCVSYRDCLEWPATGAKVVIFNGSPKNHEVAEGWVRDVWKIGGLTSLPVMDGANVDYSDILANVRANVLRELPWFDGQPWDTPRPTPIALVCGAPSMRDSLPEIRAQKRRGARIVSVNNAWRFLVENGVKPDVHVMLDARPENAAFVKDAPAGVRYLLASQCHPDVYDALLAQGREVVVWHNGFGDNAELRQILDPWWGEGPNQRPCALIPGGGTVGLRALWLCCFSGYKKVHVYGMDSSYADDGAHHAYPQALNDADQVQTVTLRGKTYRGARWMIRQAEEFKTTWADLEREGVSIFVHGKGLIPDIARILRGEAMAA